MIKLRDKTETILNYLEELFPNAHCELTYKKDYELLIAIVLSAQATDKSVNKVTPILFDKYKTLEELSSASLLDIEEIIKPIGTFKKKSKFIKDIATTLVKDNISTIPNDRKYLETLSGVGRKTINVFLSEYYKVPAIAVDTHVFRVSNRLGLANANTPLKTEEQLKKIIPQIDWSKAHHWLIYHGRRVCHSQKPDCQNCALKGDCDYFKKKDN